MPKPIDRKMYKDELIANVNKAVKWLHVAQVNDDIQGASESAGASYNSQVLVFDNDSEEFQELVEKLDHVFMHGLADATKGYWPVMQKFTHKEDQKEINAMHNVPSTLAKSRAWLYLGLKQRLLESYFSCLLVGINDKIVKKNYQRESIIRDPDCLELLLGVVQGLEHVTFQLEVDLQYLSMYAAPPVHLRRRRRRSSTDRDLATLSTSSSGYGSGYGSLGAMNGRPRKVSVPSSVQAVEEEVEVAVDAASLPASTSLPEVTAAAPEPPVNPAARWAHIEVKVAPDSPNGVEPIKVVRGAWSTTPKRQRRRHRKTSRRNSVSSAESSLSRKTSLTTSGESTPESGYRSVTGERRHQVSDQDSLLSAGVAVATAATAASSSSDSKPHSKPHREATQSWEEIFRIGPSTPIVAAREEVNDCEKTVSNGVDCREVNGRHALVVNGESEKLMVNGVTLREENEVNGLREIPAEDNVTPTVESHCNGVVMVNGKDSDSESHNRSISIYDGHNSSLDGTNTSITTVISNHSGGGGGGTVAMVTKMPSLVWLDEPRTEGDGREEVDGGQQAEGEQDTLEEFTVDFSRPENQTINLLLMLHATDDNDPVRKMYRCYVGLENGVSAAPVDVVLTSAALLLLQRNRGNLSAGAVEQNPYSVYARFNYSNIDHVAVSVEDQYIDVVGKNGHKVTVATGYAEVTRSLVASLLDLFPLLTVDRNPAMQVGAIRRWLSKAAQCELHEMRSLKYSMVHWEAYNPQAGPVLKQGEMYVKAASMTRFLPRLLPAFLSGGASSSGDTWTRAYFRLQDGHLYQYESHSNVKSPVITFAINETDCAGCRSVVDSEQRFAFELIAADSGAVYQLAATSETERIAWLQLICRMVGQPKPTKAPSLTPSRPVPAPLVSVLTPRVLYLVQEDTNTRFVRVVQNVKLENVLEVRVDPGASLYATLHLDHEESCWSLYFCATSERDGFVRALGDAWQEIFHIPLCTEQLTDPVVRKHCRGSLAALRRSLANGRVSGQVTAAE